MVLDAIPRVPISDFRPARWGGEPRVVVDDRDAWHAVRQWHCAYLKAVAGDTEVSVREVNGPPGNVFQNLADGGLTTFHDYLDWVMDGASHFGHLAQPGAAVGDITRAVRECSWETSYYLDIKLEALSSTLLNDVQSPAWYREPPIDTNFWCGIVGTSSGLHCDVTPNCNLQVIGEKHFTLFPPSQWRAVYQVPGITHCRFDPNAPDFESYPLAKDARGIECRLKPGECVYIPAGWFHQVTVVSDWAVNVNFFWRRPFPQGLNKPNLWRFLLRRGWTRFDHALKSDRPQT
jgi:hypothetical protein